jgi:homocysteine S-methyltransferase
MVFSSEGGEILAGLYRGYLDVGRSAGARMVLLTPTWRANPHRLRLAGLGDVRRVNAECFEFMNSIRSDCGDYASSVSIGGLMGCRGDAYRPEDALGRDEAEAFHADQVEALASTGIDFIIASTLPAGSEAIGMARAMAQSGLPYVPSFVARRDGTLLDGSSLADVIAEIDDTADPAPAFYMMNCVHPDVYLSVHEGLGHAKSRILGLQANTSSKPPEELDNLGALDTADPDAFADLMVKVHRRCGARILGGCCGTDERHIRGIADRLNR